MMINLREVSIRYGGRSGFLAAKDVSLQIAPGEVFGLVGESGSGKSTVLRAIAGIIPDYAGTIQVDGKALALKRGKAQFRQIQMVFQDPYGSLHPGHTVDRILAQPLTIHRMGNVEQRIARCLREVGLGPEHRFRFPHQLSGGQRQRVAIARAIIIEPRILLLDEPTSALDVSVQAEILNLLSSLRDKHGLTMLMVSHDIAAVVHMCTRLAVMFQGGIVETATADQIAEGRVDHPYTRELIDRAHSGLVRRQA
jgi:peptide/nickel transport system ATP-binding protein